MNFEKCTIMPGFCKLGHNYVSKDEQTLVKIHRRNRFWLGHLLGFIHINTKMQSKCQGVISHCAYICKCECVSSKRIIYYSWTLSSKYVRRYVTHTNNLAVLFCITFLCLRGTTTCLSNFYF